MLPEQGLLTSTVDNSFIQVNTHFFTAKYRSLKHSPLRLASRQVQSVPPGRRTQLGQWQLDIVELQQQILSLQKQTRKYRAQATIRSKALKGLEQQVHRAAAVRNEMKHSFEKQRKNGSRIVLNSQKRILDKLVSQAWCTKRSAATPRVVTRSAFN